MPVATILFACVHNAGRSQMAAALFNAAADPAMARAISAGTSPADRVHPVVVEAMAELGIDLSAVQPRRLTQKMSEGIELLVTMGCGAECPVIPGARRDDWPLTDPNHRPLTEVRAIRDDLADRIEALIAREGWGRA